MSVKLIYQNSFIQHTHHYWSPPLQVGLDTKPTTNTVYKHTLSGDTNDTAALGVSGVETYNHQIGTHFWFN